MAVKRDLMEQAYYEVKLLFGYIIEKYLIEKTFPKKPVF